MIHRCITERRRIPTPHGPLTLLILRPAAPTGEPGVLWIHGGGYVTGMAAMLHFSRARALARKYGAVVLSPEYRLAPRHPYPAAPEDCYAALLYLRDHAAELGCDPSRLMVGGESAGGGLTAAVCMLARDRGQVRVAFQMPLYPMLDDRDTPSSRDNRAPVWNTRRNHAAWRAYLGDLRDAPPVYAAPARQTDYAGLPPAYTFVGDGEPFCHETLAYVDALNRAGVPARADVYPVRVHAFDMLTPWRAVSRRAVAAFEAAYRDAAAKYRSEQTMD